MIYLDEYHSIMGDIIIISDGEKVVDLIFKNKPNYQDKLPKEYINEPDEVINKMKKWLGLHFIGIDPDFEAPYDFNNKMF